MLADEGDMGVGEDGGEGETFAQAVERKRRDMEQANQAIGRPAAGSPSTSSSPSDGKPTFDVAEARIPNLANATVPMLVDEVGDLRAQQNKIKGLLAMYEEALKARLQGATEAKGERWQMERSTSQQTRIDAELVKTILDADTLAKVQKTIPVTQMRFRAKGS